MQRGRPHLLSMEETSVLARSFPAIIFQVKKRTLKLSKTNKPKIKKKEIKKPKI